jgi:hypothetical protein
MFVVSYVLSPIHHAVPVPCVITPHLSFTHMPGPHPLFPVLMLLVPPSFPLSSVLPPVCGVLHPHPGPGPGPGPGPCTPPSIL